MRAFIDRERAKPGPHTLSEELYRACHTLAGSSKMAEARHGIRLATPLDHWLRKAFNNGAGVGITTPDLDLVADCMTAMESVASHLDENTGFFLSHEVLRTRIAEAETALDARIAEDAKQAAEAAAAAHAATIADESPETGLASVVEGNAGGHTARAREEESIDDLLGAVAAADASGEIVEEIEPSVMEDITLESRVLAGRSCRRNRRARDRLRAEREPDDGRDHG